MKEDNAPRFGTPDYRAENDPQGLEATAGKAALPRVNGSEQLHGYFEAFLKEGVLNLEN